MSSFISRQRRACNQLHFTVYEYRYRILAEPGVAMVSSLDADTSGLDLFWLLIFSGQLVVIGLALTQPLFYRLFPIENEATKLSTRRTPTLRRETGSAGVVQPGKRGIIPWQRTGHMRHRRRMAQGRVGHVSFSSAFSVTVRRLRDQTAAGLAGPHEVGAADQEGERPAKAMRSLF